MVVCASRDPVEQSLGTARRVLCWLHGPEELLTEQGTTRLEREEIAVADEA
jgi:peptide/nickel transport system ATP-binding protein